VGLIGGAVIEALKTKKIDLLNAGPLCLTPGHLQNKAEK
jgi:hypothetical protein